MQSANAPTAGFLHERLPLLDILRGFALPGILLMNIEWFSRPLGELGQGIAPDLAPADHAVAWLTFMLVQGKFWLLFSLLFGAGFTVMRQRLIASGRPFVAPYVRRCAALFVLGIAHAWLLWPGDILHSYALGGVLMLALAPLTDRDPDIAAGCRGAAGAAVFVLFTAFLGLIVVGVALRGAPDAAGLDAAAAAWDQAAAGHAAVADVYAHGSWLEVTQQRGLDLLDALLKDILFVPVACAVFLLGSWLLDSGRLARPQDFRRFHATMAMVALPLGLAITVAGSWRSTGSLDGSMSTADAVSQATHWTGALLMTFGYIGIVTLLALRPPVGAVLQRWLAPSGRMALTNYLMASAICSTLFFGYGFGLWGQVSRPAMLGIVLGVTALQLPLSAWWLARFHYGPLEWLWRAATWLQWPPLRRSGA